MATLKLPAGRTYVSKRKVNVTIQAEVRSGHAASRGFFDQFKKRHRPDDVPIKRRNTPLGAAPVPAKWSAKKNKDWEPSNQELAAHSLPADVIDQTICNIKRKDYGLRMEKLARQYPVVDPSRMRPGRPRERITQIEKGMPPERKAALRLLRKVGII